MIVTKPNLASYIAELTPRETPYPIEITETITSDWDNRYTPGTVGNILIGTPAGVYIDLSGSVIPNGVIHMDSTFSNCTALVNAPVIPNSVANMDSTFSNCTALVNAPVIPNSVANMDSTFSNCTALVNAPVIPNSVIYMTFTFYGCTALVNAPVIPNSVANMAATFNGCKALVNAPVIPNSVIHMNNTFSNCTALVDAPVIPNSVANMRFTYYSCTSLKTIGSFLVDVANCDMTNAFYNCPALEAIYVPEQEVDDWYLLYTDTKSTGTDYYTYDTAGTLLSSGTVAGTNQVMSVYGKSDELVISNTLTPERALEAATTRLQHHKIGLSYNEESFVLNAKNPDKVICNFLDKYATKAFVNAQLLDVIYPIGCYYTQYPDADSNDEATEFPISQRPETLFGGEWVEQWANESIFFRTEGTLSDIERTNGKQEDQMQGHKHNLPPFGNYGRSGGGSSVYYDGGLSGRLSGVAVTDGANGEPRTGTETRPVNRRIKVWKRTA